MIASPSVVSDSTTTNGFSCQAASVPHSALFKFGLKMKDHSGAARIAFTSGAHPVPAALHAIWKLRPQFLCSGSNALASASADSRPHTTGTSGRSGAPPAPLPST